MRRAVARRLLGCRTRAGEAAATARLGPSGCVQAADGLLPAATAAARRLTGSGAGTALLPVAVAMAARQQSSAAASAARWALAQQQAVQQSSLLARLASSQGASTSGRAAASAAAAAAAATWAPLHSAPRRLLHSAAGGRLALAPPLALRLAASAGRGGRRLQHQQAAADSYWQSLRLPEGWALPSARLLLSPEWVLGQGYNARVAIINALYTMQPHWAKMLPLLAAELATRGDPLAWCYCTPVGEVSPALHCALPPAVPTWRQHCSQCVWRRTVWPAGSQGALCRRHLGARARRRVLCGRQCAVCTGPLI